MGHASFGHYTASIRKGEWINNWACTDPGDPKEAAKAASEGVGKAPTACLWEEFDDGKVRDIDPESVVSSRAYILFYRRRGSPSC